MGDRAVSDVVSYVLIFSMVSVTVGVVSVAGVASLQDVRDVEQVSNTERAFEVLADNLADVHREGAPTRATEISLANGGLSTTSNATINVSGWSGGSLEFTTGDVTNDVIRWRASGVGGEELAYEFGAVVRSSGSGGILTRGGPFQMDTDRTIISIVQTRATDTGKFGEGIVRVRGERSIPSIVHSGDATTLDRLWLNMTTDHGIAWNGYLDDRPGTDCTLDDTGDRDRLECRLTNTTITRSELYVTVHPVNIALER
jgi:hypothetical protein